MSINENSSIVIKTSSVMKPDQFNFIHSASWAHEPMMMSLMEDSTLHRHRQLWFIHAPGQLCAHNIVSCFVPWTGKSSTSALSLRLELCCWFELNLLSLTIDINNSTMTESKLACFSVYSASLADEHRMKSTRWCRQRLAAVRRFSSPAATGTTMWFSIYSSDAMRTLSSADLSSLMVKR